MIWVLVVITLGTDYNNNSPIPDRVSMSEWSSPQKCLDAKKDIESIIKKESYTPSRTILFCKPK